MHINIIIVDFVNIQYNNGWIMLNTTSQPWQQDATEACVMEVEYIVPLPKAIPVKLRTPKKMRHSLAEFILFCFCE